MAPRRPRPSSGNHQDHQESTRRHQETTQRRQGEHTEIGFRFGGMMWFRESVSVFGGGFMGRPQPEIPPRNLHPEHDEIYFGSSRRCREAAIGLKVKPSPNRDTCHKKAHMPSSGQANPEGANRHLRVQGNSFRA